jgi:hypothetical protein
MAMLKPRHLAIGLLLTFVGIAAWAAAPAAPAGDEKELAAGRAHVQKFYAGELETLHNSFSKEMQAELTLEALRATHRQVTEQLGTEREIVDEKITNKDGFTVYLRRVRFDKQLEGVFEWHIVWREDRSVAGLFIRRGGD